MQRRDSSSKPEIPEFMTVKYLIRRPDFLQMKDYNPQFQEMKTNLENYISQVKDNIYDDLDIEYNTFRSNFYKNLETLLYQITFIKDKKLKTEKIKKTYEWFTNKLFMFRKLKNIRSKTHKLNFENEVDIKRFTKSSSYVAKNFPTSFEFKNRSVLEIDMPAKDKLKQFQTRSLIQEKREQEEKKSQAAQLTQEQLPIKVKENDLEPIPREVVIEKKDSKTNIGSNQNTQAMITLSTEPEESKIDFEDKLRNTVNSVSGFRSTQYTNNPSSTGTKFFSNTNLKRRPLMTGKNELRSSYFNYKPNYTYQNMQIDQMIRVNKVKELQEKRHKEEVKEILNNFKFKSAERKEYANQKLDLKKVLLKYERNLLNTSGEIEFKNDSIDAARNSLLLNQQEVQKLDKKDSIKIVDGEEEAKDENDRKNEEIGKRKSLGANLKSIKNLKVAKPRKQKEYSIAPPKPKDSNKPDDEVTPIATEPTVVAEPEIEDENLVKVPILGTSHKKLLTYNDTCKLAETNESVKERGLGSHNDALHKDLLTNNILRTRKFYGENNRLSLYSPEKKHIGDSLYLSKYDSTNTVFLDFVGLRPMTTAGSMLDHSNNNSSNPLNMRKTLTKFKTSKSIMRIKTSLNKNKVSVPMTLIKSALQCPEKDYIYNSAFLPGNNSSYGLLDRPIETKVKK